MKTVTLKDGNTILFRKAEKSDAKDILAYLKKIGGETDYLSFGFEGVGIDVQKEEEVISRFSAATSSIMLVGILDGVIVTDGTLSGMHQSRFAHNAELGIGVLKEYWGRGVASALMTELLEYARENQYIERVFLTVMAENERAIALYKKFGFEQKGVREKFSKVNGRCLDAIYMDLEV